MTDSAASNDTWVCGHGKRHPNPAPGYAMCCNCPADAPWIGAAATEVSTKPIRRYQELSDAEIDQAAIDDLREAYRALREHHVAETTALISKHIGLQQKYEDLSRRCEKALDNTAKILAPRAADPASLETPDHLSDDELATWAEQTGAREGTYLRMVVDELRERRDAEAMFVDADLQLQRLTGCEDCANDTHGTNDEHRAILKRWQIAQYALCALARIHRGYLRSLNATNEGDPQ